MASGDVNVERIKLEVKKELLLSIAGMKKFETKKCRCNKYNITFSNSENAVLKTLMAQLPIYCKYKSNGCQEILMKEDMTNHEQGCVYRPIFCPEINCTQKSTYHGLMEHVTEIHKGFDVIREKKFIITITNKSCVDLKRSPFSGFSFGSEGTAAASSTATVGPTSTSTLSSSFSFSGIQSIKSPIKATTPKVAEENEEGGHDNSANHDPHFKPIIPLPELVLEQQVRNFRLFRDNSQVSSSAGVDLSAASKDMPSFASLGDSSGGFSFGKKTEGFSFAGAGASVFGGANAATRASPSKADANETAEDPKPVVPLPELVQVTTGEEDEEVTFKHRAKVFRFDKEAKQWKERGVGDIKILHHKEKNTFRILLRRDQVHKIACNHYINVNQVLEPMPSCETALMWFALNYSEDEANGLPEKLAVKFRLAETKDEFRRVFEDAQSKIGNEAYGIPAATPVASQSSSELSYSSCLSKLSFKHQGLKLNNSTRISAFGFTFFEVGIITDQFMFRWIYVLGDPDVAKNFYYHVKINNGGEVEMAFSNQVRSLSEHYNDITKSFQAFFMPIVRVKEFLVDDSQRMVLEYQIRNMKEEAKDDNEESGVSDVDE